MMDNSLLFLSHVLKEWIKKTGLCQKNEIVQSLFKRKHNIEISGSSLMSFLSLKKAERTLGRQSRRLVEGVILARNHFRIATSNPLCSCSKD
jgi:hypothetical protein